MKETRTNSDRPQSQYRSGPGAYQRQQLVSARLLGQKWSTTKVILVALSVISCAIVLGVSIALAANPDIQSYIVLWTAPQAGAALLWSGIDLVTTYVGKINHQTIHPGAHVAIQLLLWMGFVVGIGLTAYILSWALTFASHDDRNAYPDYYEYYHGDDENEYYEYYSKYYIRSMEALVAFLALLTIAHFLLFCSACMDVAQRKKTGKRPSSIPLEQPGQTSAKKHEKDNGDQTDISI
ncbi:hypothetical protein F5Y11DRAFT_172559 [Daldinia sp. FL1419]|nr:hypothetical protein F5Y11DRAFT_172559 [Daldinia sp. FL1419]